MKYKIFANFGFPESIEEVIEAESMEAATAVARAKAIELAESYGFYQDEAHFGNRDQVGYDWDEEDNSYIQDGELSYSVVLLCV